jgi:PRC-barrel domain protein
MLQSIQQRYGEKLRATDGEIGHVRDFYIDDKNWAVRYLVADTGGWLAGRLVLISPHALGRLYPNGKVLLVNLTRRQIENSPSIDEHKPVSRQHEEEYHRHYGYPYYAKAWPLWGLAGYPVIVPPPRITNTRSKKVDSHLRSARFIKGYKVQATDGVVGELADFMIDGRRWIIREIVVEFGPWYAGKVIRIPAEKVTRISYDESTVHVSLAKEAVANVNESDPQPSLASSNMGI